LCQQAFAEHIQHVKQKKIPTHNGHNPFVNWHRYGSIPLAA